MAGSGNKTTWTYDTQNRKHFETKGNYVSPGLADRKDAATTIQWAYDHDGLPTTMIREDGTHVTYDYDYGHRLTSVGVSNAPAGVIGTTAQSFTYDGAGRSLMLS